MKYVQCTCTYTIYLRIFGKIMLIHYKIIALSAGLFENGSVTQRLAFKESMHDAKLGIGLHSNNRSEGMFCCRL